MPSVDVKVRASCLLLRDSSVTRRKNFSAILVYTIAGKKPSIHNIVRLSHESLLTHDGCAAIIFTLLALGT